MDEKQDKLAHLRKRAETALREAVQTPGIELQDIHELVHELSVYHIELEIQLEDLQQSYRLLAIAQQRYVNLFDFAPVGYIVTDMHGIVISANLTASSMLGINRQALEKRLFADFIPREFQDVYHLCRRAVMQTRLAQSCEVQLHKPDGTLFHAQLNTEFHDNQSETLRIAITNISTVKQAEQALHRALAYEQEISQLRQRMLLVVSHEFRTPLTSILSSLDILQRYSDRLTDEKKQERYQTIRNFVWYLNDTVQDATSIQYLDNLPHLKLQTFDVLAFTRKIAGDMQGMAQSGQKLTVEMIAQREEEPVTWDQMLFRRIMMNLISNALKYSHETVYCRLECEEETIRLRIEDRGVGISEADRPYIFEAFYRGKNVEFTQGTGIGLFVVQKAVEAHGGFIDVDTHLGEGTTFTVALPRHVSVSSA